MFIKTFRKCVCVTAEASERHEVLLLVSKLWSSGLNPHVSELLDFHASDSDQNPMTSVTVPDSEDPENESKVRRPPCCETCRSGWSGPELVFSDGSLGSSDVKVHLNSGSGELVLCSSDDGLWYGLLQCECRRTSQREEMLEAPSVERKKIKIMKIVLWGQ